MPKPELATPHYPRIEGLGLRTAGDVAPDALARQADARAGVQRSRALGPGSPRLVSSAHGDIDRLLLTIPRYAVAAIGSAGNPLADAYADLIAKLPADVAYTVVTHEGVADEVAGWFTGAGRAVEPVTVPDHLHFSVWAEDGYVAATDRDGGRTYLIEPYEFPRYADSLIADAVSTSTDVAHSQAPLYFQGGNLLIGDDFFLIGADYPANSLAYLGRILQGDPGELPVDTIHRLYRRYLDPGRELFYVGSTAPVPAQTRRAFDLDGEAWTETLHLGNRPGTTQPLFHIDMFVTLAGRDPSGDYRVMVGDPSLAADLLGVPPWPHAMQAAFDSVARSLADLGFRVHRNPLPLVHVDDAVRRERTWYFATANNALVQSDGPAGPRVWLPSYGYGAWEALAAADAANRLLWEGLGFEATLLGDFHPFAANLGAVHCITKYLARR